MSKSKKRVTPKHCITVSEEDWQTLLTYAASHDYGTVSGLLRRLAKEVNQGKVINFEPPS